MKRHILTLFILVSFISSCSDDFLERKSLTSLSEDNFWLSENDAHLALMGCYDALQSRHIFDSNPWGGGVVRTDFLSDNGYTNWQWMQGGAVAEGKHTATDGLVNNTWNNCYRAIVRCNNVVSKIPEIEDMDADVAARMIAEAKVIRATVYNILAMTFKDVPLITEPQTVEESNVPKDSQESIITFMIDDMKDAIEDLPETVPASEWGRITKGAGMAMLARIYLWHGYFGEAAAMAGNVIGMGYSLFPDYSTLFTTENEVNNEIVFSVIFDRVLDNGSSFAGYWGSGFAGYQRPLPNLVDDFYCTDGLPIDQSPLYNPDIKSENRDPRFSATLVSNGDTWRGDLVEGQKTEFMRKWTEENNNENHFDSPQDFYVIRYAHVLLMRAEALVRSGSYSESEVIGLINQIRGRVNMPKVEDVEGIGLSPGELLDIVKHERRVETAFEGLRYFDLLRWGELKEKYDEYMTGGEQQEMKDRGYPSVRDRNFLDPKHWKWPIPQSELDNNKALEQHSEWLVGG
ncbi:MAG: RagB/SusD family nutrient uptake outer membrane protein [Cytophagales bacterium]|nr:RagB/SusD family nutrient uptake outer membrane protein [Cytophagales bacterium]